MRKVTGHGLWRWALPVLLAAGACWTGNLALFNWWAAGGPPTPHPEIYEQRGNLFFLLTLALLLVAVLLAVINAGRRRAPRSPDGKPGRPE